MTFRERLNRNKRRQASLLGVIVVGVLASTIVLPRSWNLGFPLFLAAAGSFMVVMFHGERSAAFRCPLCGKSLMHFVMHTKRSLVSIDAEIRHCPYCGFAIDTEEGAKPAAKDRDPLD
jgi:predicted RNA-binding Zn-ribbon protein involved in translation (DUF1610 family)